MDTDEGISLVAIFVFNKTMTLASNSQARMLIGVEK